METLVAERLEREFIIEEGSRKTKLADPDRDWLVERVLQFYTGQYPILTTATIRSMGIVNDKRCYIFQSAIGVKG